MTSRLCVKDYSGNWKGCEGLFRQLERVKDFLDVVDHALGNEPHHKNAALATTAGELLLKKKKNRELQRYSHQEWLVQQQSTN